MVFCAEAATGGVLEWQSHFFTKFQHRISSGDCFYGTENCTSSLNTCVEVITWIT